MSFSFLSKVECRNHRRHTINIKVPYALVRTRTPTLLATRGSRMMTHSETRNNTHNKGAGPLKSKGMLPIKVCNTGRHEGTRRGRVSIRRSPLRGRDERRDDPRHRTPHTLPLLPYYTSTKLHTYLKKGGDPMPSFEQDVLP